MLVRVCFMGDCSQTHAPLSGHSVFGDSFHSMENAETLFHTFEFVRCRFGDGHGRKPQIVFFKISFLLSSNNIRAKTVDTFLEDISHFIRMLMN